MAQMPGYLQGQWHHFTGGPRQQQIPDEPQPISGQQPGGQQPGVYMTAQPGFAYNQPQTGNTVSSLQHQPQKQQPIWLAQEVPPSPPETVYSRPVSHRSYPESTQSFGVYDPYLEKLHQQQLALQQQYIPPPKKPGFWTRVNNHVSPRAIWEIIYIRDWFWPMTWRKISVLFLILCTIAAIIVTNYFFHWIDKSLAITRSYMLPVLIISTCGEPILAIITILICKLATLPKHEVELNMGKRTAEEMGLPTIAPEGPYETALVIPCHNTDLQTITNTITAARTRFRPEDIYIVDNAKSRYPTHKDKVNFRAHIRMLHPDIVYIWSPIGSKNAGQLVGALAARNKGYKYIMTTDDDVTIPKNFKPPIDMITEKFKAVAYPISGIDVNLKTSLFVVAWQDVEYRMSGMAKGAEDRMCGVQFPHGAGWFVEINAFVELMEKHHPMDFIAEDCRAGLGMAKMGLGIRLDTRSHLATEVPSTFLGPGLNWFKQRQKVWEMGRHGLLFAYIKQFFVGLPPKGRRSIHGIFWHKIVYLYFVCTIIIDWLRIPIFVALGTKLSWWRNALLLQLFSAVPPLLYNLLKCRKRKDMQVRWLAALSYPIYKIVFILAALLGAIQWLMYYLGGHQHADTIKKMMKEENWRCFWLDPRFAINPAFLADEGESIARGQRTSLPSKYSEKGGPFTNVRAMDSVDSVVENPPMPVRSGTTIHKNFVLASNPEIVHKEPVQSEYGATANQYANKLSPTHPNFARGPGSPLMPLVPGSPLRMHYSVPGTPIQNASAIPQQNVPVVQQPAVTQSAPQEQHAPQQYVQMHPMSPMVLPAPMTHYPAPEVKAVRPPSLQQRNSMPLEQQKLPQFRPSFPAAQVSPSASTSINYIPFSQQDTAPSPSRTVIQVNESQTAVVQPRVPENPFASPNDAVFDDSQLMKPRTVQLPSEPLNAASSPALRATNLLEISMNEVNKALASATEEAKAPKARGNNNSQSRESSPGRKGRRRSGGKNRSRRNSNQSNNGGNRRSTGARSDC